MPGESQVAERTLQPEEKSRWVAEGVQQLLLQRHASLLRSRNTNRVVNRVLVASAVALAWFVSIAGVREQGAAGAVAHVVALVVLLNWRLGDRRINVELTLLERSLSGEGTSFRDVKAELWEDQYAYFRAELSRAYQGSARSYRLFGEIPLWLYVTLLSFVARELASAGRFPFAH